MPTMLVPIPETDFDLTETAVLLTAWLQSGAGRSMLNDTSLPVRWPSDTDQLRAGLDKLFASSAPSP